MEEYELSFEKVVTKGGENGMEWNFKPQQGFTCD